MFPISSSTALTVARLDRDAFKTAVARGHYPCVPEAQERHARMFGEADLIALVAFARLLDVGVLARNAGAMACELRGLLDAAPGYAGTFVVSADDAGEGAIVNADTDPTAPPVLSLVIDVGAIREHIARTLPQVASDN